MSNKQDNLDNKLSDARATAERLLQQRKRQSNKIETVSKVTPKDYFLWVIVIVAFIASTLVNGYLPKYWAPATDVWVRVGIICSLIVIAIVCFFLTNQGSDFKVLVKEAGVELRRVTWPTKGETIHWTWLSIVFMALFGVLVWILDLVFTQVVGFIIGG
ncbi:MAG: preprotein translocase subunit SecE [Moraxellaceae bacterium]|nr:preprotein translocase subunit SecE [Moraxellaceae bacterium]